MANWKELWNNNYRGVGDTAELEKFVKQLNYGNRQGITYLPWAVVERIFKHQDGKVSLLLTESGTSVEIDATPISTTFDENGVETIDYIKAYFINIKVEWQGQVYVERYPLQSSTGMALQSWTQNDLNKAYQRGKVKAIASVSGIGYKLYEDGDLQFEDDDDSGTKTTAKAPTKTDSKPTPKVETPKPAPKAETPKVETPKAETPKTAPKAETPKIETQKEEPEVEPDKGAPNVDKTAIIELAKTTFLTDQIKGADISIFLKKVGKKKFDELDNAELFELNEIIAQ